MDAAGVLDKIVGGERALRLRDLARSLAPGEIPAALDKARVPPENKGGISGNAMDIIDALASRWAEFDPRAALAYGWDWKDDPGEKIPVQDGDGQMDRRRIFPRRAHGCRGSRPDKRATNFTPSSLVRSKRMTRVQRSRSRAI